jgi:hypothetical protein
VKSAELAGRRSERRGPLDTASGLTVGRAFGDAFGVVHDESKRLVSSIVIALAVSCAGSDEQSDWA